ncbi:hypothetical protein ABK040_009777 [Willaertia magna]
MLLEVCVDDWEQAVTAVKNGAKRLEVCSDLNDEGFTPSIEMTKKILNEIPKDISVHIMIRPKSSKKENIINSFFYSNEELTEMKNQITEFKKINNPNLVGFVFGCLKKEDNLITIDLNAINELIGCAKENSSKLYNITFHKAFDLITCPPLHALESLVDVGVNRILTSLSFQNRDLKGKVMDSFQSEENQILLKQWFGKVVELNSMNSPMILLLGGGVRKENSEKIINYMEQFIDTSNYELHSSTSFHIN